MLNIHKTGLNRFSNQNILHRFKQKHSNNEEVYKVNLLQDESIGLLSQSRLQTYLTNTFKRDDINEKWESMKMCIEQSAAEAVGGKRKFRKRKGLRI